MKRLLFTLLLLGSLTVMAQNPPPLKTRADGSFTQGDTYLAVLKGLQIPSGAVNTLTGVGTRVNLFYNTTDKVLYIHNGVEWKPAIEADLAQHYTKTEVDALLNGKANVNGSNATGSWPISITGNAVKWGNVTGDFGSSTGTSPNYFFGYDSPNSRAKMFEISGVQTALHLNDGTTLTNGISGSASQWNGLPRSAGNISDPTGGILTLNSSGTSAGYTSKSQIITALGIDQKATLTADNTFTGINNFENPIYSTGDVIIQGNFEAEGILQTKIGVAFPNLSTLGGAILQLPATFPNNNTSVVVDLPTATGKLALITDTEFNAAKVQALPLITDSAALSALVDYAPYRTPDGFIKYKLPSLSFTLNNDTESTITFNGQTVASGVSKTVSYTSPKELTFTRADGKPYVDLDKHIYSASNPLTLNLNSSGETLTLRNLDGSYEARFNFNGYGMPDTQPFSTTWLVPSSWNPGTFDEMTLNWDDSSGTSQTYTGSFHCSDNEHWQVTITLTDPTTRVTNLTVTGAWEATYTAIDLGDNKYLVKVPVRDITTQNAYFTVNGEYIE